MKLVDYCPLATYNDNSCLYFLNSGIIRSLLYQKLALGLRELKLLIFLFLALVRDLQNSIRWILSSIYRWLILVLLLILACSARQTAQKMYAHMNKWIKKRQTGGVIFFWDRVSLCSLDWPRTRDPPAFAFWVLGL
jgi:hypothetical protein